MRKTATCALGLTLLGAATAQASTQFFNLNTDPATATPPFAAIYGNAAWFPSGGAGAATNANDGFLRVTDAVGSQRSVIVFSDFDKGAVIQGFTFDADFRIGNGTTSPADGFSVNYVRADDPVLSVVAASGDPSSASTDPNPPTGAPWIGHGVFATGPQTEDNLPEEGTWTGVSVGFDCWNSGGTAPYAFELNQSIGPDIVGLDIRVDGILQEQVPTPTLNGSVTDATSLQTGPNDGSNSTNGLGWAHLTVSVTAAGVLNVIWKGTTVVANYQIANYFPSAGALVFAGRTGGSWEIQDIDNIGIVTLPATGVFAGTATGVQNGAAVTFSDSGVGVVDTTKPAMVSINGGTAVPATVVGKNGLITTVTYLGWPTLLLPGSTNTVTVTVEDTLGRFITASNDTFVVPYYAIVDAATAVTGVTTADRGFRMKTWQSSFEFNINWWAQEQLEGLHGTNEADTTLNTDKGYYDFATAASASQGGPVGVINMDFGGNTDGYFTTANGYTDNLWPGLTSGANGLANIDYAAADIQCFLEFPAAGVYTMGVDSDDGFKLTTGANPSDWGATLVGQYNGGRGWNSGDAVFTFAVTNAGIYPFRLVWENGTGGANCEWWSVVPAGGTPSVGSGIRVLVNDPDPTNTTKIVAYYGGPALPAYVSWEYPTPGSTRGDPLQVKANITDLGTTVTAGSVKLYLNGNALTPTVGAKVNGVTPVTAYQIPPLAAGAAATAQLVYSTSGGGPFTNTWTYTVAASYPVLDAAWAVTGVDTSKPGFRLRPWQSGTQPNTVQYTEEQLAGLYGDNNVDPALTTDKVYGMSYFDYTTNVINFDISGQNGDFNNSDAYYSDLPFPGIPALGDGLTGSSSLEALAYLYLDHPGLYTMDVNSDDGFQVTAGASPADWLTSIVLGNFNAGRGSSESFFSFLVTNAGYYPFRLIYFNGNGELPGNGANLEWSMVDSTGTPHLINDKRTEGEYGTAWAYYSGPLVPAFVSVAEPYPGNTGLTPTNLFQVSLNDGGTIVQQSSVKIFMNGAQLTPIVSKAGGITTVTMPSGYLLPPGSDTAMVVYTTTGTGGGTFSNSWSFTVMGWGGISPAWAVTGVDTTKPGFLVRPWKSTGEVNASSPNDVLRWSEEQIVGVHGVNLADVSTATDHGYIDYATGSDTSHLINWNNSGQIGDFQSPTYPDIVFPGSGGVGTWDNSAEEVITYMSFSLPGLYEMGVNSDDGFSVKVGANPKDWLNATLCGDYEGGRGSSDTLFFINVTNAGTYPIRLLWQNGGGGFNCEWFVVQSDGTKVLINDPTTSEGTGINCYYAGPALPAYVSEFWPAPGSTGDLAGQVSVELTDGSTTVNQSSISLMLNGVAVTPVVTSAGGVTKVSLPTAVAAGSNYVVSFSYTTSGGGAFTDTWSFVSSAAPFVTLSTNLWTPPGSGTNSGFAMQVYQCSGPAYILNGWDNIIRRADLGLQGLYGTNIADVSFQTNNGEMWWPGIINFAQNGDGTLGPNGNFEAADGYTDALVPGLPGPNAGTINGAGSGGAMNYDAWQARFFLEFPAAGPYILGGSSDDCFQLTEGDQCSPGGSPLHIIAPASAAGDVSALYTTTADPDGNNGFGVTPPSTVPIIGRAVLANPIDASTALVNASALAGNIAIIQRGTVAFTAKADAAQAAGAVAIIIPNNAANDTLTLPGTMGGTDSTIKIPCLFVNYSDGTNLIAKATTDTSSPVIARINAQDCSPIIGGYSSAGGRGAADNLFTIMVPKAGLYPFRLIWCNGTGGANCEFFSVDDVTGAYTPINAAASPIKAWITRNVEAAGALPAPKLEQPALVGGNVMISWTGEGELWESYSLDGPWFKSTYQSNPAMVAPSGVVKTHFFRVRQY